MNLLLTEILPQIGRGFLMGGADIIPGVSGGTVALILGIYERLVTAISRLDAEFVRLLRTGRLLTAAERCDALFLASLGTGILTGIVSLASLMHWLLNERLEPTFAVFFGLILASTWLVARLVDRWSRSAILLAVAGAVGAFTLIGLPALQSPPQGPVYVFFCGMIAICAMILPGISGSFILLLLGTYATITGALRSILQGGTSAGEPLILLAFCGGCGLGLLGFSRLLNWLLAHCHAPTMAVLCGFMLGSLRKIWPFKEVLNPEAVEFRDRQFQNILPDLSSAETWLTLLLLVASIALILILDSAARLRQRRKLNTATTPATTTREPASIDSPPGN